MYASLVYLYLRKLKLSTVDMYRGGFILPLEVYMAHMFGVVKEEQVDVSRDCSGDKTMKDRVDKSS